MAYAGEGFRRVPPRFSFSGTSGDDGTQSAVATRMSSTHDARARTHRHRPLDKRHHHRRRRNIRTETRRSFVRTRMTGACVRACYVMSVCRRRCLRRRYASVRQRLLHSRQTVRISRNPTNDTDRARRRRAVRCRSTDGCSANERARIQTNPNGRERRAIHTPFVTLPPESTTPHPDQNGVARRWSRQRKTYREDRSHRVFEKFEISSKRHVVGGGGGRGSSTGGRRTVTVTLVRVRAPPHPPANAVVVVVVEKKKALPPHRCRCVCVRWRRRLLSRTPPTVVFIDLARVAGIYCARVYRQRGKSRRSRNSTTIFFRGSGKC